MDLPGSKTRSVGQIIKNPFEHSRSHSFGPIFIEIGQDQIIPGLKTRSVGQITEKPCEHSRGHSFGLIFIKTCYRKRVMLGQKLSQ